MNRITRLTLVALLLAMTSSGAWADSPTTYVPAKVVYDFSSADPEKLKSLLDRVSMLQNLYAGDPFSASIVVVVHEGAIPMFAKRGANTRPNLTQRAQGLTLSEIIQFRICKASAALQGYGSKDFDSYLELVPMADAEIVRLQHNGYAYLQ